MFSSLRGRVDETNGFVVPIGLVHTDVMCEGVGGVDVARHLLDPHFAVEDGVLHPELTTL